MSTEFEPGAGGAAPAVWGRIETAARLMTTAADRADQALMAVLDRLAALDLPARVVTVGPARGPRLAVAVGPEGCTAHVVTAGRRRPFHEAPLAARMAAVALIPALLEAVAAAVEADVAALRS